MLSPNSLTKSDDSNLVKLRELTDKLDCMEATLSAFFDLSPVVMCIADFSGKFSRVNRAFTKALGRTEEEMCSRPWLDFVHPDDIQITIDIAAAMISGPAIGFVNRYMKPDGGYIYIRWFASIFYHNRIAFCVAEIVPPTKVGPSG